MAVLRFPTEDRMIENEAEIGATLAGLGIDYERWNLDRVPPDAPADAVLAAYAVEIEALKQHGGYVTADVIDVKFRDTRPRRHARPIRQGTHPRRG